MVKSLVAAYKADGCPINKMISTMKWGFGFELTDADIATLDKFIHIMSPFETLFSALNAENQSNIQRVYPTVLELKELLEGIRDDPNDGHAKFAELLLTEVTKSFNFVLDPTSENFEPIYLCSTYLDPSLKFLIMDDQFLIVKKYLKGTLLKFIVC